MKISCFKEENIIQKVNLTMISPIKIHLSFECSKGINENLIKKTRSINASLSSESSDELYEPKIAKTTIFDVFLMDHFNESSDIKAKIQTEIMKIAKILNWELNTLRINFQSLKLENYEFFDNRRPLKTYHLQEIAKKPFFANKNRILSEKFNEYRFFLWISDYKPYFLSVKRVFSIKKSINFFSKGK